MSMSTTKDELTTLYDQWMTAIQQLDFETLDRIIGPEYTYAATNHGRLTRQQWWDTVPAYKIKSFELKAIDVREFGHAAVAVCQYAQEAIVRGEPRSGEFLITDTWVKRDGRWQVVARSSIMMEPA
jgi:ketosteroid isomerase-like protein